MDNALIMLGLLMIICSTPVQASELLGKISTDPAALVGGITSTVPSASLPAGSASAGDDIACGTLGFGRCPALAAPVAKKNEAVATPKGTAAPAAAGKKIGVLGRKVFADNSLVRDEHGRIWLIQGTAKKPIRNLVELAKYRGLALNQAKTDELRQLQTREHLAGELIRRKNDVKIFALKKEGKHHVLNLAELARDYFGLTIYNLEQEEMQLY